MKNSLILAVVFCFFSQCIYAAPVQWNGNGHYYDLVFPAPSQHISWSDAKTSAENMSFAGFPGHLATITSAGENAFLDSTYSAQFNPAIPFVSPGDAAWIGLRAEPLAAGFSWITGEPLVYTNWFSGEPNGISNNDNVVHYEAKQGEGFAWNDNNNNALATNTRAGFFVEYEAVPEPSSAVLLFAGIVSALASLKAIHRTPRK